MKAHMSYLVGSGNEGKMQEVEGRVQKYEAQLQCFGVWARLSVYCSRCCT